MKKIIAILLILVLALSCTACGAKNVFTIDQLKNALVVQDIEVDSFDITENDGGFSFTAAIDDEFVLMGKADKNQNVTYVKFVNKGLDTSVFSTNKVFEKWYSKALTGDIWSMTFDAAARMLVALRCIDELKAFYAVANVEGNGEALTFAVNTLLNKESSEIKNWNIKVTVDEESDFDERTLVIEATFVK